MSCKHFEVTLIGEEMQYIGLSVSILSEILF
jgi:hypothetical protein